MRREDKEKLIKICRQMIRINSTSARGTVELAEFAGNHLKKLGFKVAYQRVRFCGAPQANLLARIGPKRGRPLILNTHLDTVTTDAKAWSKTGGRPFAGVVKGGRLYGLGSADTKLALACQIMALMHLKGPTFKRPLLITGTYGEEMGLVGVQKLIRSPWIRPGIALNSEPTELQLATGNKGFRIYHLKGRETQTEKISGTLYEISFQGKAAHSATSHLGRSANSHALRWLQRQGSGVVPIYFQGGLAANIVAPTCQVKAVLPKAPGRDLKEWGGKVVGKKKVKGLRVYPGVWKFLPELSHFLMGKETQGETQNLGVLKYSEGKFEALVDHRFPDERDPGVLWDLLKEFLQDHNEQSPGNYSVHLHKHNPAFSQSKASSWVGEIKKILKSMGKTPRTFMKPGCTEAGFFAMVGCEVVTVGPGESYGNIHQPNESVTIRQLEDAVVFYQRVIEKFCL